jgi:hypothetical protein
MKTFKLSGITVRFLLGICTLVMSLPVQLYAGGPLYVGSPNFGVDGQPFTWDPAAMPIQYRVDGGPMSATPGGQAVITNSAGLARVQSMFQTWQSVSTAAVSFKNAGAILPAPGFSGGDVSTAVEFNAVFGSCQAGSQSPIIFDATGGLLAQLGIDPLVIGFSAQCKLSSNGYIVADLVLLNGAFQNGVTQPQLTTNQFNQAIIHEMGHLLGLDHSQINLNLFTAAVNSGQFGACDIDDLAGLPLMFPVSFCQARLDAGLPQLAPDDLAWISRLYPSSSYSTNYATISGTIYFSDGQTPAQGVNVIARQVDNPGTAQNESLRIAVSVVSGYRFTGNPGQSVTSDYLPCSPPGQNGCPSSGFFDDNSAGSKFGSRNVAYYGTYDLPVPAGGTYTIQVESVFSRFTGGSGVGPLRPPIAVPGGIPEFWNKQESSYDDPTASDSIPTSPGQSITGVDVILNGTNPRFDQYEDGARLWNEQNIINNREYPRASEET